jgi:hypothetical protein
MVKKECFHVSFWCLLNHAIRLVLTYMMLHIINFQNMSKHLSEVSVNIFKIEFSELI